MERGISLLGLGVFIGLAWLMSADRRRISLRVVVGGLLLQFAFAALTLKTDAGRAFFVSAGDAFNGLMAFVRQGTDFTFGINNPQLAPRETLLTTVAFGVLPSIIFFSSLMSILYYLGVMQKIVWLMAVGMQRTMGTSGAESLSAAANIFVGQTEAPLLIKPFIRSMTQSEIMAVMTGGFATIAGGVMAVYVSFGVDPGHLLTASVISAPAALLMAKMIQPETEHPVTLGRVEIAVDKPGSNVIEAAAIGASDGMRLAINVAAMLIAFVALVAALNALIGWVGQSVFNRPDWTMQLAMGYVFYPFAWLIGVPEVDCHEVGKLLGTRTVLNELYAYKEFGELVQAGALQERSAMLTTYALCGFCNFASIGIQIGGIGAMCPERQPALAQLGLRAMIGGTLACFMTACVAGILL